MQEGNGRYIFKLNPGGCYVSKSVGAKIDECIIPRSYVHDETIRNNLIPQKIGIFMWRTLRGRILVKLELDKQGIDLDSLLCPMCNEVIESVDHVILSCKFAKEVWVGIHKWWNLNPMSYTNISDQLKSVNQGGIPSNLKKVCNVWATSYIIWKNRNQKVFQNNPWATPKLVNEVQVKTFEWISNPSRKGHFEWQQWLTCHFNMSFPSAINLDPG
ncbi:uncharacterized protein [Rutidosis leptorrhynchoides]|uniref:uncharacterized protein n=1 Tax=Rutidosis leptorrhynchoides TaxID=125765 RepID=UPI003A99A6E6